MVKISKSQRNKWFIYGMLLGAACFIVVYGVLCLNPLNDSWIMHKADQDIRQHYLGWCFFRDSAWGFPIGMIEGLSDPVSMSIIYTDSIPLFALLFKIINPILPQTFQYLGWFGLLSFMLTGGMASLLIRRVCDNKVMAAICPLVFILSSIMLKRMFYHTSLSAQWIVLLGLYLLLDGVAYYPDYRQRKIWGYLGFLCVSIHIYFLPITAGFICLASLERAISEKKYFENIILAIKNLIRFALPALVFMWVLGAFAVKTTTKYAVGEFGANLNTFINPDGMSRLIPPLGMLYEFQYEGAAYLGLGILLLLAVELIYCIMNKKYKGMIAGHSMRITLFVGVMVFAFVAISPTFSICSKLIFRVPYPDAVANLLGNFRSNGRFIWPAYYIIMLGAFKILAENVTSQKLPAGFSVKNSLICIIVSLVVIINIFEFSEYMMQRHEKFTQTEEKYDNTFSHYVGESIAGYKHMAVLYDNVSIIQHAAYYAYYHNMTLNCFYYARDIDEQISEQRNIIFDNLNKGIFDENTVYVFNQELYDKYKNCGLNFYPQNSYIIGVSGVLNIGE